MLFMGWVVDPTKGLEKFKPDVDALRKLNEKIHHDERVHVSLLRTGDGTSIVFKK